MKEVIVFNISEPVIFEKGSRVNRTASLTLELAKNLNAVTWVSSNFSHLSKRYLEKEEKSNPENIQMDFLRSLPYKKNLSLIRVLNNIFLGIQAFSYLILKRKPHRIYCYTPPIEVLFAAALYSKIRTVDLTLDIRDDWPDSFIAHFPRLLLPFEKIILWPWRRMLSFSMNNSNKLMASSRLQADFGKKYLNNKKKDIEVFYIGDEVISLPPEPLEDGIVRLLFVGTLSPARPLEGIIKNLINIKTVKIELDIVGNGDLYEHYLDLTREVHNITLHGRKVGDQLNTLVRKSNILLAPYKEDGYGWSLPAKISSYIGFARPILTNISNETAEILKDNNLGSIIDFDDDYKLEKAINFWVNQDLQKHFVRSRNIYENSFNMKRISKKITKYILD